MIYLRALCAIAPGRDGTITTTVAGRFPAPLDRAQRVTCARHHILVLGDAAIAAHAIRHASRGDRLPAVGCRPAASECLT